MALFVSHDANHSHALSCLDFPLVGALQAEKAAAAQQRAEAGEAAAALKASAKQAERDAIALKSQLSAATGELHGVAAERDFLAAAAQRLEAEKAALDGRLQQEQGSAEAQRAELLGRLQVRA